VIVRWKALIKLFKTVYDTTSDGSRNTSKFSPENWVPTLNSGNLVQKECKLVDGPTLEHSFLESMNL